MAHVLDFGMVCAAHGEPDRTDGQRVRTAIERLIAHTLQADRKARNVGGVRQP